MAIVLRPQICDVISPYVYEFCFTDKPIKRLLCRRPFKRPPVLLAYTCYCLLIQLYSVMMVIGWVSRVVVWPCWQLAPPIVYIYIGWQWRNFFISAVFRHFVGQALQNDCYSDVSRRHFLSKIAIVRTFSQTNWFNFIRITRQIFTI